MKKLLFLLLVPWTGMAQPNQGGGPFPLPFSSKVFTNIFPPLKNTLWVDNNGSDTTAIKGVQGKPWLTITGALSSASSGDTVFINPGDYNIYVTVTTKTNVALVASPQSVVIHNYATNAIALNIPGGISLVTGCRVSGLIITNELMDTICQRCFGIVAPAGNVLAINWIVEDCVSYGDCDNFFINHSNICSGIVRRCALYSKWDAIAISGAAHKVVFEDCIVQSIGPSIEGPGQPSRTLATSGGVGPIFIKGGTWYATNSVLAYNIFEGGLDDVRCIGTTLTVNPSQQSFNNAGGGSITLDESFSDNTFVIAGTASFTNRPTGVFASLIYTLLDTVNNTPAGVSVVVNDGFSVYTNNFTSDGKIVAATGFVGDGGSLSNVVSNPNTTNFTSYAAGTAYTLTGSSAALTFGTTQPVLTINKAGTYKISAKVGVKYNGATYAGAQTITFKLRRTNNTAADLSNGSRAVELPVLTTFTGGDVMPLPDVVYTATSGDTITIFGIVSATPAAGSVQADSADLIAERLY